ncbi:pseudouridine-5'-phosphate glycosidase [Nakamurella flavida]|uniref:pseudouridine-5'-phosphate glycosidase n=1 Tax=Nakamurella flavida TaxID=363630 RepID=UPI00278441CD|nr:pseudouridine-5'-phosphate glycosidase [Nakamurella flavida]MDP9777407.1 pseudouridine-5'-phosphate glycosidase [Nakamurella flavida]
MSPALHVHPEVAEALATGRGVVALESTLLAHGLPEGDNRRVADELEATVRAAGAVPATIAVFDGVAHIGLDADRLDRLCTPPADGALRKLSVRDLGPAAGLGLSGATTVASTAALAHRVGVEVFATGGLGGVHRVFPVGSGAAFDISADLGVLARTPIVVVCAGVKSILDVPNTLEYLETQSVAVLGYRTDAFPGFYLADSGQGVPWRVEQPGEVAAILRAQQELGVASAGVVLAQPLPVDRQLDPTLHDATLAQGMELLRSRGVVGKDVTPALLEFFHHHTGGESLRANIELVSANAGLAGQVAVELAATPRATP